MLSSHDCRGGCPACSTAADYIYITPHAVLCDTYAAARPLCALIVAFTSGAKASQHRGVLKLVGNLLPPRWWAPEPTHSRVAHGVDTVVRSVNVDEPRCPLPP